MGTGIAGLGIVNKFDGRLNLIFGRTAKEGNFSGNDVGGSKAKGEAFIGRVVKFTKEGIFFLTVIGQLDALLTFSDYRYICLANQKK